MERYTLCIPTLFGLEGLVGDEMRRMQMQNVRVEDRRVFFEGTAADIARANLRCRMGEHLVDGICRAVAVTYDTDLHLKRSSNSSTIARSALPR